jgi:hypothetical protein
MPSTPAFPYRSADLNGFLQPERRRRTRVLVRWPLLFRDAPGTVVDTVTENLSSDGFYCLTAVPFVPGEIRVCTLSAPAGHPDDGTGSILVECRVRVLRVQALSDCGLFGMGCRIEDYHVCLPATADDPAHRIGGNPEHVRRERPDWYF